MNHFVCIHSHFYQPPRENPWTERIEYQDSAYPFHDWNERIAAECYAPNALSRILDHDQWVISLINNYSKISFNFGPTLLSWLEEYQPEIYNSILEGDKESQKRYSGHGNAIAQVYNHMIMPLANRRDKETQVTWGIRDFEKRFGRSPEAMWLPETAVDTESLEVLADYGMKYVILAPHQAKAVRAFNSEKWKDVPNGSVDPTRPYLISLGGSKSITAFFYDGPVSRAVAFEGMLHNGEDFAKRIYDVFDEDNGKVQLAHIATDGETYGHHHRHGEMALSYALNFIESDKNVQLTNYGEFLQLHPAQMEAQIHDNSSWSCVHGIGRWKEDCGCNSGQHESWNQKWRKPLRQAMDQLRDRLIEPYEREVSKWSDPWKLRNAYIDLILDRSPEQRQQFIQKFALEMQHDDLVKLFKALEMQRQLMLMYTSCGWFFDEISGIETTQNIKYAYRALRLSEDLFANAQSDEFSAALVPAKSNINELNNGQEIFNRYIRPSEVNFFKLASYQCALTLVNAKPKEFSSLSASHLIEVLNCEKQKSGRTKLITGTLKVISKITTEECVVKFVALHLGDQNMSIGVADQFSENRIEGSRNEALKAFEESDIPSVIRIIDETFREDYIFTLRELAYDSRERVLRKIVQESLGNIEGTLLHIYENSYPLISFLFESEQSVPLVYKHISEFIKNRGIHSALDKHPPEFEQIHLHLKNSKSWSLSLDDAGLGLHWQKRLEQLMDLYEKDLENQDDFDGLLRVVRLTHEAPFFVDLWHIQNRYYIWQKILWPKLSKDDRKKNFIQLGKELKVRFSE